MENEDYFRVTIEDSFEINKLNMTELLKFRKSQKNYLNFQNSTYYEQYIQPYAIQKYYSKIKFYKYTDTAFIIIRIAIKNNKPIFNTDSFKTGSNNLIMIQYSFN